VSAAPDPGAHGHPRLVRFRAMTLGDVAGVAAVERASYQFPWSEGIFRDCLRVGYLCRVAELDGEIVAYGVVAMGAGEAHILNLCVRADLRGRSVGRQMLLLLL
jgi:ribosomal-protein-alanine N-acetyltransferase